MSDESHPQKHRPEAGSEQERAEMVARYVSFSGPLPPPEILREYYHIHPDLGDRVVTMAEREQMNRHQAQQRELVLSGSGQWLGAGVIVFLFLLGSVLVMQGHAVESLAAFIPAVIAFLTSIATLRRASRQKKHHAKESSGEV